MSFLEKLRSKLYTKNEYGVVYQDPLARLTDDEVTKVAAETGIKTDVHRMCVNCQLRQLLKYKGMKIKDDETGEMTEVKNFTIPCKFVPKNMPPELVVKYQELLESGRDPEIAQKILMAAIDPVAWAELAFGFNDEEEEWHLRSYQKEQLRCTSNRIVVREGRRCLRKGTPILLKDGNWRRIEDLRPGDEVVTHRNGKPASSKVSYLFNNGIKDLYRITFDSGIQLDITSNHPLYTLYAGKRKFLDLENGLAVGQLVGTIRSTKYNDIGWSQIVDIKHIGRDRSYDIEILGDHSFVANGIVTANSGKTFIMALKILWYAFNKKISKGRNTDGELIEVGPEIMIVTPFQTQLTVIFNEMEKLLKRNGDLVNEVVKSSGASLYTKTPNFKMTFRNGTVISGFVSGVGTKSDGSGGGTMRGSTAQVIYLDEMDLITDETIEKVIKPILLSDLKGEVVLIATSTPIGKRSFFYRWCLKSPDWKEDHLPSTVLPQWHRVKKLLLADTTREGIMTELMAEFIDSEYGVFKPTHIHRARRAYRYEDVSDPIWWRDNFQIKPDSQNIIKCMGIDWNKNAGTEYVIVGYLPHLHIYAVLDAINIPASEYSGMKWKETVISLNIKWQPDYIYADEGFGMTLIEDLLVFANGLKMKPKKTNFDLETIKLTDRLKAFNFSSKVELRNPVDNSTFDKPAKEFLVENSQRLFEDSGSKGAGVIWIPEDEDVLIKQLMNYVILKTHASTGKPIYGPENSAIGDHRLDALMLALGGISIETGLYGISNLAFSGLKVDPNYDFNKERTKSSDEGLSPMKMIQERLKARRGSSETSRSSFNKHGRNPWDNLPQNNSNYDPDREPIGTKRRTPSSNKYRRSF